MTDITNLAKGKQMPKTPEQFARMAELYEKALLREKEENGRWRAKYNELEQKHHKLIEHAKQEQKERDAAICDRLAKIMESGAGELEPGQRLRQAEKDIRESP